MKAIGLGFFASSLGLILAVAGCGGSGSGGGANAMFVETCSLGCSSGQGGEQVNCGIVSSYVNQDIAIYFSEPVDPTTVNASSFVVVDVNSGAVPPGIRRVESDVSPTGNPRKVFFRPSTTIDTQGNTTFGLAADHTYRVLIPGEGQGDVGPFIASIGGKKNKSRVQCDIRTTLGVVDTVAGNPTVTVLVDQAIPSTPSTTDFVSNVKVNGGTAIVDVYRLSKIKFVFNDLMNPATLAPGGIPSYIRIQVDIDGDLGTIGDRQTLFGTYTTSQSDATLETTLTFTPANGIPSSADGNGDGHQDLTPANQPRKIVITIPPDVRDLAGNGVVSTPTNLAGIVTFTPEFVLQPDVILPDANGENFTDQLLYDANKSSAKWALGRLTRGFGGGSGRLGELRIAAGETVTLNTDSQSFPLPSAPGHDILDNLLPGVHYFPGSTTQTPTVAPPLVVTDGIFEFSSLVIDFGGRLVLTGSRPARVFSRGPLSVNGIIDLSGASAVAHPSDLDDGGPGGAGGPNAGAGGKGATRADIGDPGSSGLLMCPVGQMVGCLSEGAHNFNEAVIPPDPNGRTGMGVGRDDLYGTGFTAIGPARGAGIGGVHNPEIFPITTSADPSTIGTLLFSNVGGSSCSSQQVGSPGGGAGYGTDGLAALPATPIVIPIMPPPGETNLPSVAAPGGAASLGLGGVDDLTVRKLDGPYLRGGAGGGGGGSSLYDTESVGFPENCSGQGNNLQNFRDHSGAGAGGGGGAVQLVSGKTCTISGLIDAGGGDGGSATTTGTNLRTKRAEPGGGGSGGAIRVQSSSLALVGTNQVRLDVSGGVGGTRTAMSINASMVPVSATSRGGAGGAGLLRLETRQDAEPGEFVPDAALTRDSTYPFIAPTSTQVVGPLGENILSVGTWVKPKRRPDSFSGAVSCWLKPSGNFFQLVFRPDDPLATGDARFGWNMDIRYDSGAGEQLIKYRGPDPALPATISPDFETFLGNQLNYGVPATAGSYLAVRFQGAQLIGVLPSNPCNVSLDPTVGQVVAGSLTPWVQHPSQLNQFTPRPNMLRFTVVFDYQLAQTPASIPAFIKGVTNVKISAQTD